MSSRFHVRDRMMNGWRGRQAAGPDPGVAADGTQDPGFPVARPLPDEAAAAAMPLTGGTDPVVLDTMAWDQPEKTAAYLVPGRSRLLIDAGSALSAGNLLRGLEELDVGRIEYIALTHVHPDQAGGAAVLAGRFPDATFLIHPGGAPYLSDPDRLTGRMKAMGGSHAVELFGRPGAVPESRIRTMVDGDTLDLGDRQIEVVSAPGHTATQLAWFDHRSGSLFCGDALGVRVPGSSAVRPATPPTDFSYRRSLETIERLAATGASSVCRSHFGITGDSLESECERAVSALERWHDSFLEQWGKADGDEDLIRRFNASLEANLEPVAPAVRRSLEMISPAWLNLAGMRGERDRESQAPDRLTDAA